MKKVKDLLEIDSDQIIEYLSEDNRDIKDNTMFFCLKGVNFDAHTIVDQVILDGAKVIVHTDDILDKKEGIIYYKSNDIEKTMASVANKFFDMPSSKLNLIGITGTNGKTTIAWVLYDLLNKLSSKAGYIGTIDIEYNNEVYKNLFTTPKPIELNYHLHDMVNKGVKNCALEISSHSLIKKRIDDLKIRYGIMTNLTFEHINFHGSMEEYQKAKRILFEKLDSASYSILNIDDITYEDYFKHTKSTVVSYGIDNKADFQAIDLDLKTDSSTFNLLYKDNKYLINTNLVARFNIYNLLAVLSVLVLEGYKLEEIIPLLKDINLPEGRMEIIDYNQDFNVIVDYAHTPDGFEKVFEYAKEIAKGDIIAVFGSAGGDRDREKRPVLGEIASRYCTKIILTEEDAREEPVMKINEEIKKGITIDNVILEEDRAYSVEKVLNEAKTNDTILILAKANDKYNVGPGNIPLEYEGDIDIAKRVLKERGYSNENK